VKLVEITPATGPRIFHDAARSLYAGDPNRITPLDKEIEGVFTPAKNSLFKNGEAVRWVLRDDGGRPLGRVAAFVNHDKARLRASHAGGLGFFECVDDQAAANALFDVAQPLPERQVKFADFLLKRPGYAYRHYEKRNAAKYTRDLVEILNTTWADYMEDFYPVSEKDLDVALRAARPILVEDFIWFAYKDEKPIGMLVAFPDINQVLARFDGRLNAWNMLRFLFDASRPFERFTNEGGNSALRRDAVRKTPA